MRSPACEHQPPRTYTFLMLLTPSALDAEIYRALKPIVEGECGEGTLVEPNPLADVPFAQRTKQ